MSQSASGVTDAETAAAAGAGVTEVTEVCVGAAVGVAAAGVDR